jgi:thioredoxin-like negative regulator of GroEL
LLYFRSDACSPCVAQGRYLGIIEERFQPAVAFRKVEADAEQEVAARYGVFTLPTILILDSSGAVRHANYGLTDPQRLAYQLEKML